MIGFPKYINSMGDVQNLKDMYPAELKAHLQSIYDGKDGWIATAKLEGTDTGVTDDTHKVVEVKDTDGTVTEQYQYEFKEDANCFLFKLGFATSADCKALIDSL